MLRQISFGSVKIISLNRDDLLRELRRIAHRIRAEHANVRDVRVFGSIARGDHVGTSDVDVLIVLSDTPESGGLSAQVERGRFFYPYFDLPIGVDLLVYTVTEIERGSPFISSIYAESVSVLS